MQLIYKYTCFNDFTEALVAEPKLWFSPPDKLNDPFECRPWFDFKFEPHQLVESMSRYLCRADPNITKNSATAHAVGIFLEGRHARPETWESMRSDLIACITQEIGVLCLSTTDDNILMWSHYAKQHTGICLGFEWSAYTPFFGRAQEVQYDDDFPTVDVFNASYEKQIDKIFLTKFSDWRYEKEWRIIEHDAGYGLHVYPEELLKTITFGLNTKKEDRDRVKYWAKRRGSNITFRECVLDARQFKLNICEAT